MMKLGQILIRKNLITSSQLTATVELQVLCHRKVGELLLVQGFIQEDDLQQALKEQYWRRNGFWVID